MNNSRHYLDRQVEMLKEPQDFTSQMMKRFRLALDAAAILLDHRIKIAEWVRKGSPRAKPLLITDTIITFAKSVGIITDANDVVQSSQIHANVSNLNVNESLIHRQRKERVEVDERISYSGFHPLLVKPGQYMIVNTPKYTSPLFLSSMSRTDKRDREGNLLPARVLYFLNNKYQSNYITHYNSVIVPW